MRLDHISRIVITAEHASEDQRKTLSQIQRKLLLLCCDALQNPRNHSVLNDKKHELKALVNRLTLEPNPKAIKNTNKIWKIFCSIIKAIANFLHIRVGIENLTKGLHETFDKSFIKKEPKPVYREIISSLMKQPNIDQNLRKEALKAIESFYLLAIHGDSTKALYNPHYFENLTAVKHLKEKTGLIEQKFDQSTIELMQKSLDLLVDRFEAAKNANTLNEFFENAFNSADKSLTSRYERLLGEDKEWENNWRANHPQVNGDGAAQVNAPEVPFLNLNKKNAIWERYEVFLENQMKKYGEDVQDRSEDPWHEIKERFFQNPDFRLFYANDKNFENYLIKEEKMLDVETIEEGKISRDDIRAVIDGYIDNEMLGRKPAHQVNPYNRKDGVDVDVNYKVPDVNKLLREKRTSKYTPVFEEMFKELKNHQGNLGGRFFGNTAKETIMAVYKLTLYKKELIKYLKNNNGGMFGWNFSQQLIGLILHTEHSNEEIMGVVKDAPDELVNAYKIYKEKNTLKEFFTVLNDGGGNACLEGRLRNLHEDMVQRNYFVNVKEPASLEPPVIPGTTNKKENKQKNLDFFFDLFVELQIWKYAKDKNLPIDEVWRKPWKNHEDTEPKKKIYNEENFKKEYINSENLLKFLKEEAKIVGQPTLGSFEKAELDEYVNCLDEGPIKGIPEYLEPKLLNAQLPIIKDEALFEQKGDYRKQTKVELKDRIANREVALVKITKVNENETKKQNLERLKEYFAESQAVSYANKKLIIIDKDWMVPNTGGKATILAKEEFQKDYFNKQQFKAFLRDKAFIVGKVVTDEAYFKEQDINDFVENLVDDAVIFEKEDVPA